MARTVQQRGTANFIVSESTNYRSRDAGTVNNAAGVEKLLAGTLLGQVTAGGEYVRHDSAAVDGSEVVAGVLYEGVIAGATEDRAIIARDAEVNKSHLVYEDAATAPEITAADTALAALGIIVR